MKIKKITSQSRRDFTAVMQCEHCGATSINKRGYDDDFYHSNVIPAMRCEACGKTTGDDYMPRTTKYGANEIV
jgi:hypothetical protein